MISKSRCVFTGRAIGDLTAYRSGRVIALTSSVVAGIDPGYKNTGDISSLLHRS
jgi:hypothetical protein